jgi:hypothetical protein
MNFSFPHIIHITLVVGHFPGCYAGCLFKGDPWHSGKLPCDYEVMSSSLEDSRLRRNIGKNYLHKIQSAWTFLQTLCKWDIGVPSCLFLGFGKVNMLFFNNNFDLIQYLFTTNLVKIDIT